MNEWYNKQKDRKAWKKLKKTLLNLHKMLVAYVTGKQKINETKLKMDLYETIQQLEEIFEIEDTDGKPITWEKVQEKPIRS